MNDDWPTLGDYLGNHRVAAFFNRHPRLEDLCWNTLGWAFVGASALIAVRLWRRG